jgi:hypothetical protein
LKKASMQMQFFAVQNVLSDSFGKRHLIVMFLLGAWFGAGGMAAFLVHLWIKSRERGEDGKM